MVRVLITGGAGFIGSHTADLLLCQGYHVRILDSLAAPVHRDGQVPDYLNPEFESVRGDVRDPSAWQQALDGVEIVFHLAAYQDYLTDFSRFFDVNCVGTSLLYEVIVARRLPIRKVIVASSQAVYGEGLHRCASHGDQYPAPRSLEQLERSEWELVCPVCGREMDPALTPEPVANPHNPYAISKYAAEITALRLGKRYSIPTVAMRYSITQGPRQSPRNAYSGILRIFATRLLEGLPVLVYEDGRQLRDYVAVEDVVRANLLVMVDPRADYRAFNIGSGNPTSVLEYAELLMDSIGVSREPVIGGQFRLGDTRHIVSDVSAIRSLGWEPQIPLTEIMRGYFAWVQGQGANSSYLDADRLMLDTGVVRQAAVRQGPSWRGSGGGRQP